jgi:hypothetical protein
MKRESDIFVIERSKRWDVDGEVEEENVKEEMEKDKWKVVEKERR